MPIGFYSSYDTLEHAFEQTRGNIRAKRSGVFRVYRRLDGRYETHVNLGETVPAYAELAGCYEFFPLEQVWVPIVEPVAAK